MGHVMLMGHGWGAALLGRTTVRGLIGYGRALGGAAEHAHHGGGAWPLVDPMTVSELIGAAGIERSLTRTLSAGARTGLALPLEAGETRVTLTARVAWSRGRYRTAAELGAGLAGEPFDLRGVITTSARF
jgi:hypothetical protein